MPHFEHVTQITIRTLEGGCPNGVKPERKTGRRQKEVILHTKDRTVKLKLVKKRPVSRKGKKIYTDDVIASPRFVGTFFRYKRGRTEVPQMPTPLMRQRMPFSAL
jgi:hypothetical protein